MITVPGHAFDLDPGHSRDTRDRFEHWVRFSYGPTAAAVATGLARLRTMVDEHR